MSVERVSPSALAEALATVRPLILGHGGDIAIDAIGEDGVVHVRLSGACKACPNMAITYVGPIRSCLMQVEGVAEVRCDQVNAGPKVRRQLSNRKPSGRPRDGCSAFRSKPSSASECALPAPWLFAPSRA